MTSPRFRATLLFVFLPLFLGAGRAVAQPTLSGPPGAPFSPSEAEPTAGAFALPVLYSQLDNAMGVEYTSQDFEPSEDAADNQAADDFVVPSGEVWKVHRVFVPGIYYNGSPGGPMPAVDVFLYLDDGGVPGPEIYRLRVAPPTVDIAGDLTIDLVPPADLPRGHYWLSIVAVMDFDPLGQWGWEGRSTASHELAVWRNPGDAFGTGCTDWGPAVACLTGPTDYLFELSGEIKGEEACNSGLMDFEEPFPPGDWTVETFLGGVPWTSVATCGESNYTGGSGEAACASSDVWGTGPFDTWLVSGSFGLVDVRSAVATYRANYQNLAGRDAVDFDISADGGGTWSTLLHWDSDHGTFRSTPGEIVEVDLAPFVGRTGLIARWRYFDLAVDAWDWYVQIDDVGLHCWTFADGFESGDVCSWSGVAGAPPCPPG